MLQFIHSVDNRADDLSISKPLRNEMLRWVRSPTERTSAERLGGEQESLGQLFRAPNVYPRCRGGVRTNRYCSVCRLGLSKRRSSGPSKDPAVVIPALSLTG